MHVFNATLNVTVSVAVAVSVAVTVDVDVRVSCARSTNLGLRFFPERPHAGFIGDIICISDQVILPDCIVFPRIPSISKKASASDRPCGSTLDGRIVEMSTLFPLDLVTIASGNNSLASLLWCSNALEEAVVVDAVHSVNVPATQELTRVVVTVWVSVMEDVRERVIESMRTLPIRSWSSSRLDSTRSTISFTNSFSCEGMARTRGKSAKGKTKIMVEEESERKGLQTGLTATHM